MALFTLTVQMQKRRCTERTSKLAHADGMHATVPNAKPTIALYTKLHAECDQQSAVVVDCIDRTCHARLPSPPGAVNTRSIAVAVYIAFADGRCRGEFF